MEKINNISFKGIKNIATVMHVDEGRIYNSFSLALKDDFNGKDLTEFRTALKKVNNGYFKFINFKSDDLINIESILGKSFEPDYIKLNGSRLHVNDDNLPIFSFLAKLTKKITEMHNSEMEINKDYLEYVANDALVLGQKLVKDSTENKSKHLAKFFDKDMVKTNAEYINVYINLTMNKYFNIET